MKFDRKDLLLYAVTDRAWVGALTLREQVEQALLGGATMIQLREKALCDEDFLAEAVQMKALCARYRVPFVINDNVPIAISCGADGIHVGQSDMSADNVREKIGPDKILGVSVQTAAQAVLAARQGADYLGVGAVFSTSTKPESETVSFETLKAICGAVKIPVVAIGGIYAYNLMQLAGSGIDGVAVVSAIFARPDIRAAASELRALCGQLISA